MTHIRMIIKHLYLSGMVGKYIQVILDCIMPMLPLCSVHMSINCVHMLLDLLFKHITNVSVLLYGEIRCVKNVLIISQFKIPPCEKNATPFGFICFIYLYNI